MIDEKQLVDEFNKHLRLLVVEFNLSQTERDILQETAKQVAKLAVRKAQGEDVATQFKIAWATVVSISSVRGYHLEARVKASIMDAFVRVMTIGANVLFAAL